MAYTMFVSYIADGAKSYETFDVTDIVHNIEYTTSLDSQPGKLTFMLEKDSSDTLRVGVGSPVQFFCDGKAVFYGKVFVIETDLSDVYKVTAYDYLRYLKNSDSVVVDESYTSIEQLFTKIMNAYTPVLKGKLASWKNQVQLQALEPHNFSNETLFDILSYYMDIESDRMTKSLAPNSVYASSNNSNLLTRLYLKCNLNKIEMREVMYDFLYEEDGTKKTTALLIGDESLMTNYNYKVDIDKSTYNRLIFVYNEEDANSASEESNTQVKEKQIFAAMDAGYEINLPNSTLNGQKIGENTLSRWGILSKIIELKNIEIEAKLEEYMKTAIEVYSQPNRSLKVNAIGYNGIYAGSGFYLHLSKLGVNYPVYVISATHRYEADEHMMELEIATNSNMRKFL